MNNEFIDYYKLLGLSKDATPEEIKNVYHEIAQYLHPDAHPGKTFSEEELDTMRAQFTKVTEAYHILKNPKSRRAYDREYVAYYEDLARRQEARQSTYERVRAENRRRYREESEAHACYRGQTTQAGYTPNPQPRRKKETFMQSIKRQYKEVRQDEKKFSFRKRHANIDAAYYESFAEKVDSLPKEILYYTGKGTVHIFLETLYQLSRLTYINKDQATKFIIRNRRLVAAAAAAGIICSCGMTSRDVPTGTVREAENITTSIETPVEEEQVEEGIILPEPVYEPRIVMQRYYTIQSGDNLSTIARNSNTSVEELKEINGYDTNTIYAGRMMSVPYTIQTEDLEYYTENVKLNEYSLEEIAKAYETDIDTLRRLNPDVIVKYGDKYYSLTDSILVPKFITKDELLQAKNTGNAIYY